MAVRGRSALLMGVLSLALANCSNHSVAAPALPSDLLTVSPQPTDSDVERVSAVTPVSQLRPALLRDDDLPTLRPARALSLRLAPCIGASEPALPHRATRVSHAVSNGQGTGVLIEQMTDLPTPVGQPGNQASNDFMRQVRGTWRCSFAGTRPPPGTAYKMSMVVAPSIAEASALAFRVASPSGKLVCDVVWLQQGDFVVRLDICGALQSRDAAQRYSVLAITALKRALA